jgi:hypothetical protein
VDTDHAVVPHQAGNPLTVDRLVHVRVIGEFGRDPSVPVRVVPEFEVVLNPLAQSIISSLPGRPCRPGGTPLIKA